MIEVLPDMPEGVTGICVSGRLRGNDLGEFKPAMKELLKSGEIRIVEVVAPDYEGFGPGGLIEDLKLGLGALIQHHSAFKRIAVVSDNDWVAHALHAFAWMVPGELALFSLEELERAKEWAAGASRAGPCAGQAVSATWPHNRRLSGGNRGRRPSLVEHHGSLVQVGHRCASMSFDLCATPFFLEVIPLAPHL